ncbi:MAG: hypothetical protein WC477_07705 [Patescibacteria group bacterium]
MSNLKIQPPGISSKALLGPINAVKNMCHSYAGLVIGTSAAEKVKLTNNTDVSVNGKMFQLAASAELAFTATTDDIEADANNVREAVYLYVVDEDGATSLFKGDEASGSGNAVVPETPEGKACIGYVRVAVAAGSTKFDATSDSLAAGHITDTYVNFSCNKADWGA